MTVERTLSLEIQCFLLRWIEFITNQLELSLALQEFVYSKLTPFWISLRLFHIWKVGPSPHRHTQARATRINNLTHDVYCHIYKIFLIPNWN